MRVHRVITTITVCIVAVLLVPRCAHGKDGCVNPSTLIRSAVELSRYDGFDEKNNPINYTQGSGFFLDATHIVTIAHVAEQIAVLGRWTTIHERQLNPLENHEIRRAIPVRIAGIARSGSAEDTVVLELAEPFIGAQHADIRTEPLEPGEHVIGIGFPGGMFRIVQGRFTEMRRVFNLERNSTYNEYPIEVEDYLGHRDVFGPGASGSAIFDCSGRVSLLLSQVLSGVTVFECARTRGTCVRQKQTTYDIPPRGTPTHLAVPPTGLRGFVEVLREEARQ